MNRDPDVPPGVLPWRFPAGPLGRVRNAIGDTLLRWLARPVLNEIDRHRKPHGLPRLRGLNTALESLSNELPVVAIPITNDQPGVASRLEWLGVAEVVQPRKLSASRLRAALEKVLGATLWARGRKGV